MAARASKLARAAWTALVVLFAVRAVAGSVLCDLYGQHALPPSAAVASQAQRDDTRAAAAHEHHSAHQHPADDRTDHACDEPVYLIDASASTPNVKPLSVPDEVVWTRAALAARPAAVAATVVSCRHRTHPPASISALDLSRRLRI